MCKRVCCSKCPAVLMKVLMIIKRKLMYNSILRACLETYFKTCIFLFVSSNAVEAYTFDGKLNLLMLMLTAVACLGFPFFVGKFIHENSEEMTLHKKEVR